MKGEYQIGDWVAVSTDIPDLYYDEQGQRQMRIIHHDPPYSAQIVGACTRMLGKYVSGKDVANYFTDGAPEWEPACMEVSQVIDFWLVRRGMTNKPVMVRAGDLQRAIGDNKGVPWKWTNPYKWTDKDRKAMSLEAKNFKRDEKGRFLPL